MRVLVAGVGNLDRTDDGVGVVAAGLAADQLPSEVEVRGSVRPLDLLELWGSFDAVYVLDGVVSGAPPGTVHRWELAEGRVLSASPGVSTHGLGVAEVVELGRALGRLPPVLVVYGVEVASLRPGQVLTPEVRRGAEEAARQLAQEVAAARARRR
ncbi:MAG: hydrogenase maturation protease [Armatimonadota bacterium]|nr:hydrogenase maturation protease [Armatimonadota bacterium]MDR7595743.1 hydrogenase maturation protease [Armatimonadota bacterium]